MQGQVDFQTLTRIMSATPAEDRFWVVERHGDDFHRTLNAIKAQREVGYIALNEGAGLIAFRAKAFIRTETISSAEIPIAADLDNESAFAQGVQDGMDAIIEGIK